MVSFLKTISADNLTNRINSPCCEIEVLASNSAENKKRQSFNGLPFWKSCRDDKIRTCDPTPPRRVRYRAALHPEFEILNRYIKGWAKVIENFNFKNLNLSYLSATFYT